MMDRSIPQNLPCNCDIVFSNSATTHLENKGYEKSELKKSRKMQQVKIIKANENVLLNQQKSAFDLTLYIL